MRRLLIVVLLLLFGGCISHDPGTLRHYPHLHSYTPCPMYAGWESHYADPEYQPEADLLYPEGAGPTYGDIPSFLWVSKDIRRLLTQPTPGESLVPVPDALVHNSETGL